jgi:glycerol-3-phosphate dehydrogenase
MASARYELMTVERIRRLDGRQHVPEQSSIVNRLAKIRGQSFDVAIIGGGIVGCGIARDASRRGLSVVLFEQHDFGSGTTAASTRIVHGGLRYLERADFRLVRLDLRERETLLRIAPHLVKPLQFLIPFYGAGLVQRLKLRIGLALYDALSFDSSLPRRSIISADDAKSLYPVVDRPALRGAAAYYDARIDFPERLCVENLVDARAHGAQAFNYVEGTAPLRIGSAMSGVRVRDRLTSDEVEIRARMTVNASGPWLERVAGILTPKPPGRIRTTKGIHIVCPSMTEHALVLFSRVDGRLMFAIPRLGHTWIGTTDTDYTGDPRDAVALREEVDYVIESVRHVFPTLSVDDVAYTTAGVRALVMQRGSASSVSRMHKVVDGELTGTPGLVSILGGKITGYRSIARDATDLLCRHLGVTHRSDTADAPLPGAPLSNQPPPDAVTHLYDVYGARASEVLQIARARPALAMPLSPRYPVIGAEAAFAVRAEYCATLADFVRRRSLLGASLDQGWDAVPAAASILAEELGWSPAERTRQIEAYRRDIEKTQTFRNSVLGRAAGGNGVG